VSDKSAVTKKTTFQPLVGSLTVRFGFPSTGNCIAYAALISHELNTETWQVISETLSFFAEMIVKIQIWSQK
jgi:hypothetical protein